jgi:hypothetical protein
MAPVTILDDYYLAITALITIAYQLSFFSIAFYFKFDKLTGMKFSQSKKLTHRLSPTLVSS